MRFSLFTAAVTCASIASATITWTLDKAANPSRDQADAYERIDAAMTAAVARHTRITDASKDIRVSYIAGIPTAQGGYDGNIKFGSDRTYMTERVALHEIAHTLGVGLTPTFRTLCAFGDWLTALPLLRSWDGPDSTIHCGGGGHFWPYGLNYDDEWSEENADRHCEIVQAMLDDGM